MTRALATVPAEEHTKTLAAKDLLEMTQQQAYESLSEAELEIYEELHKIYSSRLEDDIWWNWNLGKKVSELYKTAQVDHKIYRQYLLERLSIALAGNKTAAVLYTALRVIEKWPTKTKMNDMIKLRGPNGSRLTWTHLVYLSAVNADNMCLQMATSALSQGWSCKDLLAVLQRIQSNTTVPARIESADGTRRGRKPKIPKSVTECFTHMSEAAQSFSNTSEVSWLGKDFDLVSALKDLPPDKLEPEYCVEIDKILTQFAKMEEYVKRIRVVLLAAKTVADLRISTQATHDASVADEAETVAIEPPKKAKQVAKAMPAPILSIASTRASRGRAGSTR